MPIVLQKHCKLNKESIQYPLVIFIYEKTEFRIKMKTN